MKLYCFIRDGQLKCTPSERLAKQMSTDNIINAEFISNERCPTEAEKNAVRATFIKNGVMPNLERKSMFSDRLYAFLRAVDYSLLDGNSRFTPEGLTTLLRILLEDVS